jgi:hypothetical protein
MKKRLAIAAFACTLLAGSAMAGPGRNGHGGPGNGGGHAPGWGWAPGLNVFVDVPMTGAAAGQTEDPRDDRCREARHSCFGLWGVEQPGYGQCMARSGCL